MKLKQFQVRGFRCIRDSGLVPVGHLAALIGKNENGKTALLQALVHLNVDSAIGELDRCDEMWDEFQSNPQLRIVEGTFELTTDEKKLIVDQVAGAPEITILKIFRTVEPQVQYEFPSVEFRPRVELNATADTAFQALLQKLRADIEPLTLRSEMEEGPLGPKAEELSSLWAELGNTENRNRQRIVEALAALRDILSLRTEFVNSLTTLETASRGLFKDIPIRPEVDKVIREKLHPKFVYFSDYKQIKVAIKLTQYLAAPVTPEVGALDTGEPLDKRETIDNLFYLAGLDPKRLDAIKNSPSLKNKYLTECSERLTLALRPTWITQAIEVELIHDTGDVLWVKVTDVHDDGKRTNKGLLSRRAVGFIWHFSFFVNFTAETRKAELRNSILLLDEPGLHLHPAQQSGTLEVLKRLAGTNQIIYTTHSPFMIFDYTVGHLLTVELDRNTHLSSIRTTYWDSSPETLIPILHALGAPEAFAGAAREASKRPVALVEGVTDYQYLTAVQDLMATRRPQSAPKLANVNLVPANTSSAIGPLAMYHKTRGKPVVALYDNEPQARVLAGELVKLGFPEDKIVFCTVEAKVECDIEDCFTELQYLDAVNRLYSDVLKDARFKPITREQIKAKKKERPELVRTVQIYEAIWDDNKERKWGKFDKKGVCDKLCELMYSEKNYLEETTLDRFDTLLSKIADALKPAAVSAPGVASSSSPTSAVPNG